MTCSHTVLQCMHSQNAKGSALTEEVPKGFGTSLSALVRQSATRVPNAFGTRQLPIAETLFRFPKLTNTTSLTPVNWRFVTHAAMKHFIVMFFLVVGCVLLSPFTSSAPVVITSRHDLQANEGPSSEVIHARSNPVENGKEKIKALNDENKDKKNGDKSQQNGKGKSFCGTKL